MPDVAWKRHEREVAELLGGRRVPRPRSRPSGLLDVPKIVPNVEVGRWRLQVRTVPRLPRWMASALGLVQRHTWGGYRGALVVVQSSQGVPTERWAVLPFDDYRALLQRAGDLDEPIPAPKTAPLRRVPNVAPICPEGNDILDRWFGANPLLER